MALTQEGCFASACRYFELIFRKCRGQSFLHRKKSAGRLPLVCRFFCACPAFSLLPAGLFSLFEGRASICLCVPLRRRGLSRRRRVRCRSACSKPPTCCLSDGCRRMACAPARPVCCLAVCLRALQKSSPCGHSLRTAAVPAPVCVRNFSSAGYRLYCRGAFRARSPRRG